MGDYCSSQLALAVHWCIMKLTFTLNLKQYQYCLKYVWFFILGTVPHIECSSHKSSPEQDKTRHCEASTTKCFENLWLEEKSYFDWWIVKWQLLLASSRFADMWRVYALVLIFPKNDSVSHKNQNKCNTVVMIDRRGVYLWTYKPFFLEWPDQGDLSPCFTELPFLRMAGNQSFRKFSFLTSRIQFPCCVGDSGCCNLKTGIFPKLFQDLPSLEGLQDLCYIESYWVRRMQT